MLNDSVATCTDICAEASRNLMGRNDSREFQLPDRSSPSAGDVTAVDAVSLKVEAAEIYGLIGPNDAGKSTLIKMLTTMLSIAIARNTGPLEHVQSAVP